MNNTGDNARSGEMQDNDFIKKLFLNMPMGYFRLKIVLSSDGSVVDYQYLDVNDKFLEIMGRSREDFVGRMHTEIGPIFVNKLDLQILGDIAYRGRVYESKANRFRSNDRYYDTNIYSPHYGDVVALFTDVTESVLATQALQKSEQELKRLYQNTPVGIEVYDKDGVMIDMNDREAEILGVADRNTLLGINLFDHPSLPAFAADKLRKGKDVTFHVSLDAMKLNREYYGLKVEDSKLHYLTVKCAVLHNAEGEIDAYMLIVIDNTDMYETSARLEKAKQKAEESDRLKSSFIANMSHEIRTPLNAIVGFSNVLAQTEDSEEKQQYISIIEENNNHLLALISDILDLSKIESEEIMEVNFSEVNLADLCRQIVLSMQFKVSEGVELSYDGDPQNDLFTLDTDLRLLTQVISNLTANALKFTSQGEVRLGFSVNGKRAKITIQDTGIGMSPVQINSVFERFVKFNDFIPGTGLGLAISKSIVDKLGGHIGVESEGKGCGSKFWFTIPV